MTEGEWRCHFTRSPQRSAGKKNVVYGTSDLVDADDFLGQLAQLGKK